MNRDLIILMAGILLILKYNCTAKMQTRTERLAWAEWMAGTGMGMAISILSTVHLLGLEKNTNLLMSVLSIVVVICICAAMLGIILWWLELFAPPDH